MALAPKWQARVDAEERTGQVLVERSLTGRRWRLSAEQPAMARAISQQHDLPEIVGRVLAARGIGLEAVPRFLAPRLRDWLPDPSHLLDLDRAVERLVAAVIAQEPVGLIGDYDVDGATSTALAKGWLEALGCPVHVRIPDRLTDGYGPNVRALSSLAEAGCGLVLCLDSGTTAHAPLEAARTMSLDVIVVDHHAAEDRLPPALAVINPNRLDQVSPLGELAAVGVTFVLLVALNRALRDIGRDGDRPMPDLLSMLDLVALGTVCDVVPLHGLNRAFVVQGLKVARSGSNPGLAALARAAGVETVDNAKQLGFALGPRLNAGGRMGESGLGAELLSCRDPVRIDTIAARLNELNTQRQTLERLTLETALRAAEAQAKRDAPVLLVAGDGWHQGVIGIVAARLAERFARPAVVVGIDGGIGTGSGRSCQGYDLGAAIIAARQAGILREGGGHPMAAGLRIEAAKLTALRDFLCQHPATDRFSPGSAELSVDGSLQTTALNLALIHKLEQLGPFGAGHPEPRFAVTGERILQARVVGKGHVSCLLAGASGPAVRAVAFRAADNGLAQPLLDGTPLRLVGRPRRDTWRGEDRVTFEIDDAAPLA